MGTLFYDTPLALFTVVGIVLIFLVILVVVLVDGAKERERKARLAEKRQKAMELKQSESLFTEAEETVLENLSDGTVPTEETPSDTPCEQTAQPTENNTTGA